MDWEVKTVKPLENHILLLTFKNDEQKYYDVKPLLETGVFKTLKDNEMFKTVRVCFDSIAWDNNVDIAPETLYYEGISVNDSMKKSYGNK